MHHAEKRFALRRRGSICPKRCARPPMIRSRSEEHTSELQSLAYLVCRLLLEKKKKQKQNPYLPTTKTKNILAYKHMTYIYYPHYSYHINSYNILQLLYCCISYSY